MPPTRKASPKKGSLSLFRQPLLKTLTSLYSRRYPVGTAQPQQEAKNFFMARRSGSGASTWIQWEAWGMDSTF